MKSHHPSKKITHLIQIMLFTSIIFIISVGKTEFDDLKLPILLNAGSTDYAGEDSMLLFEDLELKQGKIGIRADNGHASKLDFENSIWQFSGNVIIDTENSHVESEVADLKFSGHRLQFATIVGSPAIFEIRRAENDQVTYAQANQLKYDFEAGIIEFSGNAIITEAGNQISSNYLIYNINERRIKAQSNGAGDPRVKITYTPGLLIKNQNDKENKKKPEDQE